MIKTAIFGLLLAGSTAAFAQSTTTTDPLAPGSASTGNASTGTTTANQPATPATPATPAIPAASAGTATTPAVPASPATPSDSATTTTTTTTTTDGAVTAESVVKTDWSKYDANSNEALSRTEFNKWVSDLQAAAGSKAPTRGYLTSAFQKADSNKNGAVSQTELQTFLGS